MRGRNTFNVACLLSGLAWGATVTFGLLEPQQRAYFGWGCLFAPAIGLVAGVELSSRPDAVGARGYDVMVDCFNRGLVLRNSGDALALSPPLIVERSHIDDIVAMLGDALKRAA